MTIRKAIPRKWLTDIEKNPKSKVICDSKDILVKSGTGKYVKLNLLKNKEIYRLVLKEKECVSYCSETWKKILNFEDNTEVFKDMFRFIFNTLIENEEKIFRWKLFHRIIPNQILLKKWKIENNDLCCVCHVRDTYEHYFIDCVCLDVLWQKITTAFKTLGYNKNFRRLEYIVIGYKIRYKEYKEINYLLSLIGFTTYKWFHLSKTRTKHIDITKIYINELNKKLLLNKYKNLPLLQRIITIW